MDLLSIAVGIIIGTIISYAEEKFRGQGCKFCKHKFEHKFKNES